MKKFASLTGQEGGRWILIFSVLAGLFFSGGEGVHLLPFSIAEGNSSKNTHSVLERNLKSYALSVHNTGNHSPLFKSRFQRDINQHPASGYLIFDWSNNQANFCLRSTLNHQEASLFHSSVCLSSQPGRAPPAV
jgi:hypothetical protein